MWLLSWIPNIIYHVILTLSVLAFLCFSLIPAASVLGNYRGGLKLIAVLVIIPCIYVEGKIAKEQEFQQKLDQLSAELADEQKKSAQVTANVQYIYVDRVKTVKDVQVVYKDRIKTIAAEIDKSCRVDPKVIDLLNSAASYPVGH